MTYSISVYLDLYELNFKYKVFLRNHIHKWRENSKTKEKKGSPIFLPYLPGQQGLSLDPHVCVKEPAHWPSHDQSHQRPSAAPSP